MSPLNQLTEWPAAYSRGTDWPPGLEASPQTYAAELYLRGIDGYIWAEGYVVQGPIAGTLVKTGIPYWPKRDHGGTEQVKR